MLRSGNVHSAERWRQVLGPIVERYRKTGVRLLFSAEAAFAKPEVYEYLEPRDIGYAIRLPANQVRLQLFVLAYNLGNFLRRLGLTEGNQRLVIAQSSSEADQDRGTDCVPCPTVRFPVG